MTDPIPTSTPTLQVNTAALQANWLAQLQHLLDMVAFSFTAAAKVDEEAYTSFAPFMSVHPAHDRRLPLDAAARAAEIWYLRNSLRDAVEIINAFLDECYIVCSIFRLFPQGEIKGEEVNKILSQDRLTFHKRNLPDKITTLDREFGVSSPVDVHVLSLNRVRACLVHRLGVVGAPDLDANRELGVTWHTTRVFVGSPDGAQRNEITTPGVVVEAGWTVEISTQDVRKVFQQGDQVTLTFRELYDSFFSFITFVLTLVQSVDAYGRSTGIITTPAPAGAA